VRVTVGPRALARGCVEVKARREAEAAEVPVAEVAARVAAMLASQVGGGSGA